MLSLHNILSFYTKFYSSSEINNKLTVAISAIIFLLLFTLVFVYLFHKFYWKIREARRFFWIFMISFSVIAVAKFTLGLFYRGYIPEILIFFAIPSPKMSGYLWFLLALIIFVSFLYFRKKIESLSVNKFLLSLFVIFFIFSLSVAAIREGLASVADPYTRTYWEYTGNIPYVHGVKNFLHNYIVFMLPPTPVAQHSTTHPPGYTLILYFFNRFFSAGFLGMAILTILSAGLVLWPLYYLWKYFLSELEVRRALEIFIFLPSAVMMTATSTESFLLLFTWTAISCCFIGWKKSWLLSILGGLAAAAALLSNFIFLLLGPFFIFLYWYSWHGAGVAEKRNLFFRAGLSLLFFSLFFIFLWKWSGYSIIDNYFTAKVGVQDVVKSNFESLPMYVFYFLLNIFNFLIYLGIPFVYLFFSGWPATFKTSNIIFKSGFAVLAFFLAIGIFQGNVERLWLFVLPFFVIFANKLFKEEHQSLFNPLLMLIFFQIIATQIIFYTFY